MTKKKKVIKLEIPIELLKKIGRRIREWFKDHGLKVSVMLLVITFLLLGSRLKCGCNEKKGFWYKFDYDPPKVEDVRETLKR